MIATYAYITSHNYSFPAAGPRSASRTLFRRTSSPGRTEPDSISLLALFSLAGRPAPSGISSSVISNIRRASAAISAAPPSPSPPPSSENELLRDRPPERDPRVEPVGVELCEAVASWAMWGARRVEERMLWSSSWSPDSRSWTIVQTAICWNVASVLLRKRWRYLCRPPSGWSHTSLNGP